MMGGKQEFEQFASQKVFSVVMISSQYLNYRCIYKLRYNADIYV